MNHPQTMGILAGLHQAELRAEADRARVAREVRRANGSVRPSTPALRLRRRFGIASTAALLSLGAIAASAVSM